MSGRPAFADTGHMPRYMLEHRHAPRECGVVFASFNAFESPLRHKEVCATCSFGTHRIWWELEADTEAEALSQLPHYVAERTTVTRVRLVQVP
jgi:hypothetical protein